MRLAYVSALALTLFLSCAEQPKDMWMEDGVLVVNAAQLFGAVSGDIVTVHVNELYRLAEERKLIPPRIKDAQAKDLCGGSGSCQGTCPDGVTVLLWGWNENLCVCSFTAGVLRVQCLGMGCPTLEIRCGAVSG